MTFKVSNGKIILKVPAIFKIHTHSHKKYYSIKSEGKTSLLSFKTSMNLLTRVEKYMQRFLLRRPSLSTCPFFLDKCDQGREQSPSASLQAWHSGDQRNAGGYEKAQTTTLPQGILAAAAAQETKESREVKIPNN